ncbi:unnamed protein product [Meloidogyne enterolobii]|uniref:Uncharacterized protein n=1 Tax=Meloidogyne enterolobii TaxID=390850 RepID=A0ACB0YQY5_MELEN
MFGINETDRSILPVCIFELPMKNLIQRLNDINYSKRFSTLEFKREQEEISNGGNTTIDSKSFREEEETCGIQSLLVKERDIEYQYQRMRLFRHLLAAWPSKSELLRAESCHDIPPVYRGAVWAAILGVLPFNKNGENSDDHLWQSFYSLDTFSEHISDRQLQVDIPRCHQYDELMSSPLAHHQLKILLKALLVSRKDEFVYWQGLDSLSAPFLILHFNDLSTAFCCLNAFIDRYLRGFFLKDNTIVIRSYLAEFMRVIEFCDSELFAHLVSLDFQPELFAIPWFLTCFAHVLPLHKLFHLWDALLLSDSEFPLFIGVAILLQLRSKLIKANFNEAILLFSDLPDLPIDQVVSTAKFYHSRWQMSISDYFKNNSVTASPRIGGGKKSSNNNTPAKLTLENEGEKSTIPWVEKYRPKKVDQVLCQEEVVAVLNKCLNGADLPNILFYGPPGTGKTSCAIALCRQLFPSSQLYKDRVLELNASDERGINVVRNRIKEFARIAVSSSSSASKTSIPPLKIVILDEADAMTGPAQSALRRTMENETQTTRFFLICNYVTRIIEPLTSRCAKFRFKPLSEEAQKERLLNISIAEKINFDENAIEQLVSISNGDLRKSITLMQSMACSAVNNSISVEDVKEMSGEIPGKLMEEFIDVVKCLDQEKVNCYAKKIVKNGYSVTQYLTQLLDIILGYQNLKEVKKAKIFIKIAETEKCLIDGADEYIQLLNLLLTCQGCFADMD